jgi:pimeloyl-ACP methyl ester carboxylesterase
MLARGDVDPERIGLYGQSLGGSIALNVMADRSEIGAAVIESAFTGWRAIAADALGGGLIGQGLAAICIPEGHRAVDALATIDRPILILHGTQDSVIPVHHGRELAAAAPNAELIELTGGDHNTLRATHPRIEQLVIGFFRTHLVESPAADEPMQNPGGEAGGSVQP